MLMRSIIGRFNCRQFAITAIINTTIMLAKRHKFQRISDEWNNISIKMVIAQSCNIHVGY